MEKEKTVVGSEETTEKQKSKFRFTKQHLQGAIAMFIVCALMVITIELPTGMLVGTLMSSNNSSGGKAKVEYIPSTGKRTGIKSIEMNGLKYIDIYEGKFNENATQRKTSFYKDILTKNINGHAILNDWSELAYTILSQNSKHSAVNVEDKFDTYMSGKADTEYGWTDLVRDFRKTTSGATEKNKGDMTTWTGLKYSNSLASVRKDMSSLIASNVGRKMKANGALDHTDGGNALYLLDDDTPRDVMYTIVTPVRRQNPKYFYNSFGLAFYDFTFEVLADENIEFITAAEGYNSVEDASKANVPGTTYRKVNEKQPTLSYAENTSDIQTTQGISVTNGDSMSLTNSITHSEQYTFQESVHGGFKWGTATDWFGGSLDFTFTFTQMFGSSAMKSEAVTQSHQVTSSQTTTMPPHTAIGVQVASGTVEQTMTYQAPVAIGYKVAVFSLTGHYYDDNVWTQSYSTAGYVQKHFCALIGMKGNAQLDLVDRMEKNNYSGYEASLDATYGWSKTRLDGNAASTVNTLNWNTIKGKTAVSNSVSGLSNGDVVSKRIRTIVPMSAFGAKLSSMLDSITTTVNQVEAYYPIRSVRFADRSTITSRSLKPNESVNISVFDLGLVGYNDLGVRYHGFNPLWGKWVLSDANGKETPDNNVVTMNYNKDSGLIDIKANRTGTVYLKYVISDNTYPSVSEKGKNASPGQVSPCYIKLDVQEEVFEGYLEIWGEINGKIGDSIDLNSSDSPISAHAFNPSGKEVKIDNKEVVWEAKYTEGVQINGSILKIEKAGKYPIRAIYKGVYSDWTTMNVRD